MKDSKTVSLQETNNLIGDDPKTVVIEKPRYDNKILNTAHWAVNYIGIGWVVNAFVSIKIYDFLKKNTQVEQKGEQAIAKAAIRIIKPLKTLSPEAILQAESMSHTFVQVALMGIGGFAVTPLQKLYGTFQNKIGHATLKIKDSITGKTELKEDVAIVSPPLHHERLGHWISGKAVGFFAACTSVMVLTHAFPKFVPAVSQKVTDALQKSIWSKISGETVKKYVIEQYAAVLSIASLALVKPWLDKKYPPLKDSYPLDKAIPVPAGAPLRQEEIVVSEKSDDTLRQKTFLPQEKKSFLERVDNTSARQSSASL